uniref:Antitoxin n=1 Tax=Bursaphelenchus xylophilus TaxID=6326 RepID=A0A1I7RX84_BURXY
MKKLVIGPKIALVRRPASSRTRYKVLMEKAAEAVKKKAKDTLKAVGEGAACHPDGQRRTRELAKNAVDPEVDEKVRRHERKLSKPEY